MAEAPLSSPRDPNAPPQGPSAYSETVLAMGPRQSLPNDARGSMLQPALTGALVVEDTFSQRRTVSEKIRALPVAIQGIWLGLACITLLIASAAAMRSLFASPTASTLMHPVASAQTATPVVTARTTASAPATAAAQPTAPGTMTIGAGGGSSSLGGFGALAIRDRLPGHIRLRRIGPFMDDLERLLAIEPTAIDRADVRKMVGDAAVYALVASPQGGALAPEAERIFTFLTTRAGTAGPDILFDLVATRGGTRAATYAEDLLKRDDIRAKGTPALRIAADMRLAATCQDRTALFERAKAEGDRRVLATLFTMARCGRGPTDCCMANDAAYREVVRVITTKK
ncbi:MAG: hypothetical protein U0441_28150 [Polyangiaceae bacterium]